MSQDAEGSDDLNKTTGPGHCPLTTDLDSATESGDYQVDTPELGNLRYILCQEIQRGGMGIIFSALDQQLPREVAIKVLRPERTSATEAIRRFSNEARIMGFLPHPGVPPIYECGICADGRPYHVMKLINGATLAEMLHHGHLTTSQSLRIFADICQTIAFAHSRGVIHLDLKPGNVMVGAFGEVHVTDWGLARFEDPQLEQMATWFDAEAIDKTSSNVRGTLQYMPPEQARGEPLDTRADVFGLGAILCEILIGHAPYQGDSVKQIYSRAVRGSMNAALIDLEQCDTDRALVRLARRCLAPDPKNRPEDAGAVAKELATYQESALQQIEGDMNRFFDLSLDLFCIADFEGYFRRINSNFSRVLGYNRNELTSRPFIDFVHPEDREQTLDRMSRLRQGQPVVRFRNRYRASSGNYLSLEWTAKSVREEHLVFAVARDVTQT